MNEVKNVTIEAVGMPSYIKSIKVESVKGVEK